MHDIILALCRPDAVRVSERYVYSDKVSGVRHFRPTRAEGGIEVTLQQERHEEPAVDDGGQPAEFEPADEGPASGEGVLIPNGRPVSSGPNHDSST